MKKKDRIIRTIIQILAFISFPESFAVSFFALKRISRLLALGKFQGMGSPLLTLAATIPAAILLGRYYCGYLCSFGAVQDVMYYLPGRLFEKKRKVISRQISPAGLLGKLLTKVKYVILAVCLIAAAADLKGLTIQGPWSAYAALIRLRNLEIGRILTFAGLLLLIVLLFSMLVYRPFCQYFCPMGAMYSLLSVRSGDRRTKPNDGNFCSGDCSICQVQCKKQRVNYKSLIGSILLFLAVQLALHFFLQTPAMGSQSYASGEATGLYADGSYTASGEGFGGKLEVTVTIADGVMTGITIDSCRDDRSYMETVLSELLPLVLEQQNTEADTVSGATYSSRGLLEAIDKALLQSKAIREGEPVPEEETGRMDFSDIEDGEYEGTAVGFRGDLTVLVTVADGQIENLRIVSYYDNKEYLFCACASVFDQILEKQDLNVDTVTGATYSRNGLIKAVANALDMNESAYELAEARPRADKNKDSHHITQKFIENDEEQEKMCEKYKDLQFDVNGIRIK